MVTKKRDLGDIGEEIARKWLNNKGSWFWTKITSKGGVKSTLWLNNAR